MISNIIDQLRRDEGLRLVPYRDTKGFLTVGYGHNLDAHPQDMAQIVAGQITNAQAEQWLLNDVQMVLEQFRTKMPWVYELSEVYRGVLTNMAFNMGIAKVQTFGTFLVLMRSHNYAGAAADLEGTLWASQVPERARRLHKQLLVGEWQ